MSSGDMMKNMRLKGLVVLILFVMFLTVLISGCTGVQSETFELADINTRVVCPEVGNGSCSGSCSMIYIPNPNDISYTIEADGVIIKNEKDLVKLDVSEMSCVYIEITRNDGSVLGRKFYLENDCSKWSLNNCKMGVVD
jgi:hypothetical protein